MGSPAGTHHGVLLLLSLSGSGDRPCESLQGSASPISQCGPECPRGVLQHASCQSKAQGKPWAGHCPPRGRTLVMICAAPPICTATLPAAAIEILVNGSPPPGGFLKVSELLCAVHVLRTS